jgi:hypothetical protein
MADGRMSSCPSFITIALWRVDGPQLIQWLILQTGNEQRTARVADLLSDYLILQSYIAAAPTDPQDQNDYYTEGWIALRQCSIDGQHIANSAAESRVPRVRGGPEEQEKAQLELYVLRTPCI